MAAPGDRSRCGQCFGAQGMQFVAYEKGVEDAEVEAIIARTLKHG